MKTMKTLLLTLMVLPTLLLADITSMFIERIPAVEADRERGIEAADEYFVANVYGLLSEGQAKRIELKAGDVQRVLNVENCAHLNLGRRANRIWVYFKPDGSIDRLDVHLETPFSSTVWSALQDMPRDNATVLANKAQVRSQMATLKTLILSK